jgi:hypothetical protein
MWMWGSKVSKISNVALLRDELSILIGAPSVNRITGIRRGERENGRRVNVIAEPFMVILIDQNRQ